MRLLVLLLGTAVLAIALTFVGMIRDARKVLDDPVPGYRRAGLL